MAFPPRPGMVPAGIPLPPGMPMYVTPGVIPIPHIVQAPPRPSGGGGGGRGGNVRGGGGAGQHAPPKNVPSGPPVTVFVGNITERAQDAMINHLLTTCGPVISWKRVQGATGRLQAFGFCEYGNPDAACRAIRLLHDMEVGDKKLVVKVDAKTKETLDNYKKQRRKMLPGYKSPKNGEEPDESLDYMDDSMKHEDRLAKERVDAILRDHSKEMMNYVPKEEWKKDYYQRREFHQSGPKESLDDVQMEDGKREIINSEIHKFRETMKLREAEKEEEKKKREKEVDDTRQKRRGSRDSKEHEPERSKPPSSRNSRRGSRRRSTSTSPTRGHSRSKSPQIVREIRSRSRRHRSRSRSRSRSYDDRRRGDRDRERDNRDRDRDRDRDRERGTPGRKDPKDIWKEREMDEEEKDRKKQERKAREKEASYQERLRKWESRESRVAKEYEKEKQKEHRKKEEMEREAKKLREFLEDYDDERDDEKFYKGREMERRLMERQRESQKDAEDRAREKEEVDELRAQIMKEGHHDPNAELQRRIAEKEGTVFTPQPQPPPPIQQQQQQPQLIPAPPVSVPPNQHLSPAANIVMPPNMMAAVAPNHQMIIPPNENGGFVHNVVQDDDDDYHDTSEINHEGVSPPHDDDIGSSPPTSAPGTMGFTPTIILPPQSASAAVPVPVPKPSTTLHSPAGSIPTTTTTSSAAAGNDQSSASSKTHTSSSSSHSSSRSSSKKKLDVRDVFNQDDDDSGTTSNKKRKLPLPSTDGGSSRKRDDGGGGKSSSDDKRKHIKSLIEKIPTDKKALFEYNIDWEMVDNQLMEKRIRPWVNKKIAEYIGEPEPTLTDFICSKVLAGSTPRAILEDVQMVLDEEAEVFVVKMWRLLIYEIENKKHKAAISTASAS